MGWHVVTEKRLNAGDGGFPSVAVLSDGSLVVGYTLQSYITALGLLVVGPVSLRAATIGLTGTVSNSFTLDSAISPLDISYSISAGPDRNFAFSWTDVASGANGPNDVRAQRFVGAGLPTGAVLRATTDLGGPETDSDVALLTNRMAFMAWTESSQTGADRSGTSIRGQLFTNVGLISGQPFQINTSATGDQTDAHVTAFSEGRFLVTWRDGSTFRGQQYASDQFRIGVVRVGSEVNLGATFLTARERVGGGFTAISDGVKLDVARDYNLKGSLISSRTVFPSDGLSLGDGRHLEVGQSGTDTVLRVVSDTGQASGIEIFAGNLTLGAFDYAVPFGDGLVAVFRQTHTREGILQTPNSEITTTIIDTKRYDGDNRDEVIIGGSRADVLNGAGGNDVIEGRGGNDSLNGGDGNDRLDGGAGIDTLDGGAGNDTLSASDAGDVLFGGGGDDFILLSGEAAGALITTSSRIAMSAGQAAKVDGGQGLDTVVVEGGKDQVFDMTLLDLQGIEGLQVTAGSTVGTTEIRLDTAQFGKGGLSASFALTGLDVADAREMLRLFVSDGAAFSMNRWSFADWGKQGEQIVIAGSAADDWIRGSAWNDNLRGGGGADDLFGGKRADKIFGGDGDDRLAGGRGADRIWGDAGADTFVLHRASDSGRGQRADHIVDFIIGEDVLDLSELATGGRFIGHHKFHDVAGEVRRVGDRLLGDVDGDGRADWSVVLDGITGISASDLLFA